jgi:CheY-like chemotaxis protein
MTQTGKSKLQITNKSNQISILHVDDDQSLLEITKLMLMDVNANFVIDTACCVDEAFKKLSAKKYDVVVSDFEMPKKDGLQFLKEIREQNPSIPFILFTGKGREEVAIQALNLGANGYYNKQGSPETVYGELSFGIINSVKQSRLVEDLKQKYAIIESVTESIGAGLTIIGKDYRIIWANKFLRDVGGKENKLCYSVYNKLNAVCPDCGVRRIIEEESTFDSHEYTNIDSKGEIFWTELIVTPIKDEKGNVIAALELAISITERKKNEEKLRKANWSLRALKTDKGQALVNY